MHDTGIYVLPFAVGGEPVRDKNGRIDLDVPIEGDINDPKFKPWPIVWQVLKNLLTKAVAAPGRLLARAFGGGEDDAEEVRFEPLQTAVGKEQRRSWMRWWEGPASEERPGLFAGAGGGPGAGA